MSYIGVKTPLDDVNKIILDNRPAYKYLQPKTAYSLTEPSPCLATIKITELTLLTSCMLLLFVHMEAGANNQTVHIKHQSKRCHFKTSTRLLFWNQHKHINIP